jgi:hypothetical protein
MASFRLTSIEPDHTKNIWITLAMLQKMNKFHGRLVLIFLAALIVRVLCAVIFSGEIDTEGAEYARIAQNIVAGKGYVGIATEGTQLFFPPLISASHRCSVVSHG